MRGDARRVPRLRQQRVEPLEQVLEDPRGRAPDEMLADDVWVGLEGDPPAGEGRTRLPAGYVLERELEDRVDLALRRAPLLGRADRAHIGVNDVVRRERRRRG